MRRETTGSGRAEAKAAVSHSSAAGLGRHRLDTSELSRALKRCVRLRASRRGLRGQEAAFSTDTSVKRNVKVPKTRVCGRGRGGK